MPGMNEILRFTEIFGERFAENNRANEFQLVPMHSSVFDATQNALLFKPCTDGKRKVIVATNIAESSITVPDVKYVIDFCLAKQVSFNIRQKTERLELTWASRASLRQRAGRTGRVADGVCYRLVPLREFELRHEAYSVPEM